MASTSPVQQNLAIVYGDSPAENLAVNELISTSPNTKIIDSNSLFVNSELRRSFNGAVFVIGHGEDQGIISKSKLIPWSEINNKIAIASNMEIIYIACNSSQAALKLNGFGFPGEVEPIFASRVASFLIKQSSEAFDSILSRYQEISQNPDNYHPLGKSYSIKVTSHVAWWVEYAVDIQVFFKLTGGDIELAGYGAVLAIAAISVLAGFGSPTFGIVVGIYFGFLWNKIAASSAYRSDGAVVFGFDFHLYLAGAASGWGLVQSDEVADDYGGKNGNAGRKYISYIDSTMIFALILVLNLFRLANTHGYWRTF